VPFSPSTYQQAVFDWIDSGKGDGIVVAVAGSGKTTTLVQAAGRLRITSSVFLAFNKHIADELGQRLKGTGMAARTFHSVGNAMLTRRIGQPQIDNRKYRNLVHEHFDGRQTLPKELKNEIMATTTKLVDLARVTLTNINDEDALRDLCIHHNLIPFDEAVSAAPFVILKGIYRAETHHEIDFTDMIYLPLEWGLQPRKLRWVFVDECQDLNAMQLKLAMGMRAEGGRMLFVGDEKQAIYGFSGADAQSFRRIKAVTGATELPLSICYRCPSSHLDLARAIVPQIEARPDAPVGEIIYEPKEEKLHEIVQEGDLIISRMTAPLVTWCIKLIQKRVAARVRGRDIGRDLVSILEKIEESRRGVFSYEDLPAYLKSYEVQQIDYLVKRDADDGQLQNVRDRVECLQVCYKSFDHAMSVQALGDAINGLFSDDRTSVWMSTIHKAKGLENDRVIILKPDDLPLVWEDQKPWQFEQELNLKYVALTRAKQTLIVMGKAPETGPSVAAKTAMDRSALDLVQVRLVDRETGIAMLLHPESIPLRGPLIEDELDVLCLRLNGKRYHFKVFSATVWIKQQPNGPNTPFDRSENLAANTVYDEETSEWDLSSVAMLIADYERLHPFSR
jgi:DNA helicase-2/ATP-dependent DNA helicase PcrA